MRKSTKGVFTKVFFAALFAMAGAQVLGVPAQLIAGGGLIIAAALFLVVALVDFLIPL